MVAPSERRGNPAFEIAGVVVPPGRRRLLDLPADRLVTGTELKIPAAVVNGRHPGPWLWITGAVHGDELNGVEIVRRVVEATDARKLAGAIVAVPIVNVLGFIDGSRYLPDRRDLNRSFPGSHRGSSASRLARLIYDNVIAKCDVGIDFHTGSDHRANLPQIRADLDDPQTRQLALAFGAPLMVHAKLRDGSLRQAGNELGKPVLVYEGGEAHRFDRDAIEMAVAGTLRVMAEMEMIARTGAFDAKPIEARSSTWLRARRSGILRLETGLGDHVDTGQTIGTIGDALGGRPSRIVVKRPGWVVGIAQRPLVNRGDAVVHVAHAEAP